MQIPKKIYKKMEDKISKREKVFLRDRKRGNFNLDLTQ